MSNSNLPIGFNHIDCQTLKLIDFDGNLLFVGGKEVFFFSFAERYFLMVPKPPIGKPGCLPKDKPFMQLYLIFRSPKIIKYLLLLSKQTDVPKTYTRWKRFK